MRSSTFHSRSPNSPIRCGAILSMELVLIMPILLLLLFAIVQFTCLLSARTRISTAAHSAARQLCLFNADAEELRQHVRRAIGPKLANGASLRISDPGKAGQWARVEILIPMKNATPDLLWFTGYSITGRNLVASASMMKESRSDCQLTGDVAHTKLVRQ